MRSSRAVPPAEQHEAPGDTAGGLVRTRWAWGGRGGVSCAPWCHRRPGRPTRRAGTAIPPVVLPQCAPASGHARRSEHDVPKRKRRATGRGTPGWRRAGSTAHQRMRGCRASRPRPTVSVPFRQVTEPGLLRRAFVSSATVKWLEPRSPTLDVTLGVSVAEAGALGNTVVGALSPWRVECSSSDFASRHRLDVTGRYPTRLSHPGLAPPGTPCTIWMQITRSEAKGFDCVRELATSHTQN